MTIHHYFSQRSASSPLRSTYEIDDDSGRIYLRATGSAVKALRAITKLGFAVPADMNGPQIKQFSVKLTERQ